MNLQKRHEKNQKISATLLSKTPTLEKLCELDSCKKVFLVRGKKTEC